MLAFVQSTPRFGEATKPFRDAGIEARALLPIAPVDARISNVGDLEEKVLGKAPGRFNRKKNDWRGLGGGYVRDGVPKKEIEDIQTWPTPNVGILGRYAPGIDSDACNDDARRLVERVLIDVFGRDAEIAERIRGTGPRRLYAFKAASLNDENRVVRTRHISYRLAGEDDLDKAHQIDVIGMGNQYLIAGTHPSGDQYEWADDWALTDLWQSGRIQTVENADINRFIEAFREELEKEGGQIVRSTGGRAPGEERDYSDEEPIMPVKTILDGLDRIPNNEENFPHRDNFVVALSAIRAALGCEAENNYEHVAAWACEDPVWCSDEYFEKVWNSLDRGVRVDRNALDRIFRRNGVFESARAEFTGDARALTADIREDKAKKRKKEDELLDEVAARYVFGHANNRTGIKTPQMRSIRHPDREWSLLDWWYYQTTQKEVALVEELRSCERWSDPKQGVWNFARDMADQHPTRWYSSETRHPLYKRGDIVVEENPDGTFTCEINMRFQSRVQFLAQKPASDLQQSRRDTAIILEFIERVFGSLAHYELDTLAYMAQTGKRPGHMLFLVGGQGVGKSLYAEMLISMFDGIGKGINSRIDGTTLTAGSSNRFAWSRVEGCRIISIKELPDGSSTANMAAITSKLKQVVDPGPDGDYIEIEAKGKDSRPVRNFARIVITSNYANAVHVEQQDRRIFYVSSGIVPEEKPNEGYYERLFDVTKNPERLAAFWRYLLSRDIAHYQASKPPPVSREKQEAQITGIHDPVERHMRAALATLRQGGRRIFDLKELAALMSAMSENEYANTNGAIDDRKAYDFGRMPSAAKRLEREAIKIRALKSNGERVATIYGFRTARPAIEALASSNGPAVREALDEDRARSRLSSDHIWEVFSGPLKGPTRIGH